MNVLLDTHALLWFLNGSKELSAKARKTIETEDKRKFVSIASIWEIAIKISLGKLNFEPGLANLDALIFENGFEILPITIEHTLVVSSLEFIHRDPFDRILIAQAHFEKCTILTRDENISKYEVKVIW